METWMDIKGYIGRYMVSDLGRVKSLLGKGRFLKLVPDKQGYLTVGLSCNGIRRTFKVHRLVCISFIPNEKNLPQVNHINGIKDDNNISNLEWCSSRDNSKHSYDMGLQDKMFGESNGRSKLKESCVVKIRSLLNDNDLTQKEIANMFNISNSQVSAIKTGRSWRNING